MKKIDDFKLANEMLEMLRVFIQPSLTITFYPTLL